MRIGGTHSEAGRLVPGRLTRLNSLNTERTAETPRPRLKPRGLPPALESHGVWAATNPADAAVYGNDLFGSHRVHLQDSSQRSFEATFHGVLIRDVTLGYLDYARHVKVSSLALPDNYLVIVPAAGTSTIQTAGVAIDASPVMAAVPSAGSPLTIECGPEAAHLIVRIDRNALETHLSRLIGRTVDRPIVFQPAFDLSTGAASRWNFAVQMLHAELYEGESLLHRASGLGPLEEFLMSALLFCQPSNFSEQLEPTKSPASETVLRAIEFVEQHLAEAFTVQEVANAAGVSMRTLQNQFASDLDQTPTNYIRNRRLERTRSDLADGSAHLGVTVTDIATRWGFTHLGRFAKIYRSRYGESPSQTLRS